MDAARRSAEREENCLSAFSAAIGAPKELTGSAKNADANADNWLNAPGVRERIADLQEQTAEECGMEGIDYAKSLVATGSSNSRPVPDARLDPDNARHEARRIRILIRQSAGGAGARLGVRIV